MAILDTRMSETGPTRVGELNKSIILIHILKKKTVKSHSPFQI